MGGDRGKNNWLRCGVWNFKRAGALNLLRFGGLLRQEKFVDTLVIRIVFRTMICRRLAFAKWIPRCIRDVRKVVRVMKVLYILTSSVILQYLA